MYISSKLKMRWRKGKADFLKAMVLASLCAGPKHGYEMLHMIQTSPFYEGLNPGALYRVLRELEMEGFVVSSWSLGGGPPKRIYYITKEGRAWLEAFKSFLEGYKVYLEELIKRKEG